MAANKNQQADLIDILDVFLRTFKQPIHYKELTRNIIECGAWVPYGGSKPDQIVYSAMHQDMRKRGNWSAFRLVGPGIFCTSEVKAVEAIAIPMLPTPKRVQTVKRKLGDTEADMERKRAHMAEGARCGNCALLSFSAIEEYRMQQGECGGWPESGRACARVSAEPCSKWIRISPDAADTRAKRKDDIRMYLIKNGFMTSSESDIQRVEEHKKRKGQRNATR